MNKIKYLIIAFVFIGQFLFSQTNNYNNFISPPGTSKVSDNLYLDKVEVSNVYWWEFVSYIKNKDSISYLQLMPDSNITKYDYIKGCWSKSNSKFDNYPVTGITFEQALAYCKWRSEVVTMKKNHPFCPTGTCNMKYWKKFDKFDPDRKY